MIEGNGTMQTIEISDEFPQIGEDKLGKIPEKTLFEHYSEYRKKSDQPINPLALFVQNSLGSKTPLNPKTQTQREELQRYIGYEEGLPLILSLPYDMTMNTNLPNATYLDITMVLFLLLPLLLIVPGRFKANIGAGIFLLIILAFSVFSVYATAEGSLAGAYDLIDEKAGQHPGGIQWLVGGLFKVLMSIAFAIGGLLMPLYQLLAKIPLLGVLVGMIGMATLVWFFAKERFKDSSTTLKVTMTYMAGYLFLWGLFGNGVSWYAFNGLSLLLLLPIYYFAHPDKLYGKEWSRFTRNAFGTVIAVSLIFNVFIRFYNGAGGNTGTIFNNAFLSYSSQKMNPIGALEEVNPFYAKAVREMNKDPEAKVYRVGTFLNFHINQNDTRVFNDNQLGYFDYIHSRLKNKKDFVRVLKRNGFRYILYDLKSAWIDQTPEQSLKKKNATFIDLIRESLGIRLVATDHLVEDTTGGSVEIGGVKIPGKAGFGGKETYFGSFVLFEIR